MLVLYRLETPLPPFFPLCICFIVYAVQIEIQVLCAVT
jgi:hypothetical protein